MYIEHWKQIANFNDYLVSDQGRIKSLKHGKERILKPGLIGNGYYAVGIGGKTTSVHQLVALYFVENTRNVPFINHKNGIKTDNRADNLEWCTRSENIQHAYHTGLNKNRGIRHKLHKLTQDQVDFIRDSVGSFSRKDIALMFNITQGEISNILNGRCWKQY